MKLKLQFNTER